MSEDANATRYRAGNRVVGHGPMFRGKAGTITRAGRGVSVQLRWDGANRDERVYLDNLRPETSDHVADREHAKRMNEWRKARPITNTAFIEYDYRSGTPKEMGAQVRRVATPAEMREGARELLLIADWFETRPTTKGSTT